MYSIKLIYLEHPSFFIELQKIYFELLNTTDRYTVFPTFSYPFYFIFLYTLQNSMLVYSRWNERKNNKIIKAIHFFKEDFMIIPIIKFLNLLSISLWRSYVCCISIQYACYIVVLSNYPGYFFKQNPHTFNRASCIIINNKYVIRKKMRKSIKLFIMNKNINFKPHRVVCIRTSANLVDFI